MSITVCIKRIRIQVKSSKKHCSVILALFKSTIYKGIFSKREYRRAGNTYLVWNGIKGVINMNKMLCLFSIQILVFWSKLIYIIICFLSNVKIVYHFPRNKNFLVCVISVSAHDSNLMDKITSSVPIKGSDFYYQYLHHQNSGNFVDGKYGTFLIMPKSGQFFHMKSLKILIKKSQPWNGRGSRILLRQY